WVKFAAIVFGFHRHAGALLSEVSIQQRGRLGCGGAIGRVESEITGGEIESSVAVEVGAGETVPPAATAAGEAIRIGAFDETAGAVVVPRTDMGPLCGDDQVRMSVAVEITKQRALDQTGGGEPRRGGGDVDEASAVVAQEQAARSFGV